MPIEKIQKLNVAQNVYTQLREMIFAGEWTSGQRIPSENALSEQFGVSRPTIRQAIQKLDALGLVTTKPGEGTFVCEKSLGPHLQQIMPAVCLEDNNIYQVIQYRLIMEPECAALAAIKPNEADIRELWNQYNLMTAPGVDIDSCVEHDIAFHNQLVRMTGNAILLQVQQILQDVLRRTITDLTREFTNDSGIKYHKLILEAIQRRDSEAAERYMRAHIQETMSNYEAKYEIQR